jgi:1-acyl-sn-glycerol-3-phosphate acyltransferase
MYYSIRRNRMHIQIKKAIKRTQRLVWIARVCLFYLLGVVLLYSSLGLICLFVLILRASYKTKYRICLYFSYSFVFAAKVICGLNYRVEGLEKLPSTPSVLLSNHQSFWENVFVQIVIPRHSWVIKKELFDIPLFGWCLKKMDPIAIDRQNKTSVKDILTKGIKKLNSGLWLVIFPEGTRLKPTQNTKLKPSGIKVAMMASVPIVIMVHNAGIFWPKGIWIKRPGTIKVKIAEVIYPEQFAGLDVRTLTDQIEEIMVHQKSLLAKTNK